MSEPKDIEVAQPPNDGISSLAFSPVSDFLAATSWDNQLRIWEVASNGQTQPKMMIAHEAPPLCSAWYKDGSKIFTGGASKVGKLTDLMTQQSTAIVNHDAPIKTAFFFDHSNMPNMLVTGSWDKTVKYWDLRQQAPVSVVSLPERVYAMDVTAPLMVVATAERHICIFDLTNPSQIFKTIPSPLKFQTRTVGNFINKSGFAVASIEGRVAIQYVEEKDSSMNFSFKCHRDGSNVYSINAISFHPTYGTFSTAGADGTFNFWDKDSKQRLKQFPNLGTPISCSCFNRDGRIFAYAVSYDWSKGHEFARADNKNRILLKAPLDEDIKPRANTKKR